MEESEINSIIASIEAAVPVEGAIANLEIKELEMGGGIKYPENHLIANRAGYLRLAAFMLRAAVAPYEEESSSVIAIDPQDDLDKGADFFLERCERSEDLKQEEVKPIENESSFWEPLLWIGCLWLVIACCALLIIGAVTAWNWVF